MKIKTRKKIATMILTLMMSIMAISFGTTVAYAADPTPTPAAGSNSIDDKFEITGGKLSIKNASEGADGAFTSILTKYKGVITFVSAIAALTLLGVFILNFMKIGTSSANPSDLAKAKNACLWSGIAAALLGSVSLFFGIFYGMLADGKPTP